jgi:hypothetical protein
MKSVLIRFVYDRLIVFAGSVGFSLVAYILARLFFDLNF